MSLNACVSLNKIEMRLNKNISVMLIKALSIFFVTVNKLCRNIKSVTISAMLAKTHFHCVTISWSNNYECLFHPCNVNNSLIE